MPRKKKGAVFMDSIADTLSDTLLPYEFRQKEEFLIFF
jgi:hypothetical protein